MYFFLWFCITTLSDWLLCHTIRSTEPKPIVITRFPALRASADSIYFNF